MGEEAPRRLEGHDQRGGDPRVRERAGGEGPLSSRTRVAAAAAALVLLVAAIYAQTARFAFLAWDDTEYVTANDVVKAGLTADGLRWALSPQAANWFPLTWLSHMTDVALFGVASGPHHLVNAALHAAAALALVLFLGAATGRPGRAFLVAALFAVHPLNVESVAWIAERKNVLSTLFWFLTCGAYVAFARRKAALRYALVAILFGLGLMSKPMLVTLPAVLLLLDVWPLTRLPLDTPVPDFLRRARVLLVEKVPLFALAVAAAVATFAAQARWSATSSLASIPLLDRVANAFTSAAAYLVDAFWPAGLSPFYPHPATLSRPVPLLPALASAVFLTTVSVLVVRARRARPYLLVGWSWYLVTLLPVIGLVQVGSQARADRYAYVPLVGIFVMAVWGLSDLADSLRVERAPRAALAAAVCLAFGVAARKQTTYWRDGGTLYLRAVEVTRDNWLMWNNLGTYHLDRQEDAAALAAYTRAASIKPDYADAHYNRGDALARLGRLREAVSETELSLRLEPRNADGWNNLAVLYAAAGRAAEAKACALRALELRRDPAP